MTNSRKCPVCGAITSAYEVLPNKINTANVVRSFNANVNLVDLTFYHCDQCGHGFIDNFLDSEFYEDFSVAMIGLKEGDKPIVDSRAAEFERMIAMLKDVSDDMESLLEIGSGGGYLLLEAKKHYRTVMGVEPSKKETEVARAKGLNIINDFFSPSLNIKERFSAFISTMVFEHIPDVRESMLYAYELLKEGGAGVIQVPNGQRTFFGKVDFDVYPQHLHYFTPLSLAKLASGVGFEVVSVGTIHNANYIEMVVRKSVNKNSFNLQKEDLISSLNKEINSYDKVALWGASYAARSLVNSIKAENIKHFFDMSRTKAGNFISGFPLIIEYPKDETVKDMELIVILASEYSKEIITILKEDFGYKGKIVYFDEKCRLQRL